MYRMFICTEWRKITRFKITPLLFVCCTKNIPTFSIHNFIFIIYHLSSIFYFLSLLIKTEAVARTGPIETELWVDKYKPASCKGIIGQQGDWAFKAPPPSWPLLVVKQKSLGLKRVLWTLNIPKIILQSLSLWSDH